MLYRFAELLKRMAPRVLVDPDRVIGTCLYCGTPVHHKDGSNFFFETATHFSCRRLARAAECTPLMIQRTYIRIAEIMHRYTPELFLELEDDLIPFLKKEKPGHEDLCRLASLIIRRAEQSEHVSEFGLYALKRHLGEIRRPFLASAN